MVVKHNDKYYVKLEKTGKLIPEGGYGTKAEADHLLATIEEHKNSLRDELTPDAVESMGGLERSRPARGLERRAITTRVEIRAAPEGSDSPGCLVGYAAMFDKYSDDLGRFVEKIDKGAFERALRESDIRALRNHEPEALLGRMSSKTLRLKEDDNGLRMEIDLPNTTVGRDTAEMVRRGDMSGCSFSFDARSEAWDYDSSPPVRTLRDVDVADVGPVTFPAYRDTSIALRSLESHRPFHPTPLALLKARLRIAEAY